MLSSIPGQMSLELVLKKCSIIYIFNDNGCGFLMKDIQLRQKGFGLENIKRRVDDMDGQLQITSGKSGTSIQIEIPIRQHEKR